VLLRNTTLSRSAFLSESTPTTNHYPASIIAFLPESTPLRISSVLLGPSAGLPVPGLLRRVTNCPYALPSFLVAAFLPESTPLRISSMLLGPSAGSRVPGLLRRVTHRSYALPSSLVAASLLYQSRRIVDLLVQAIRDMSFQRF
jgi:hypothetical protein